MSPVGLNYLYQKRPEKHMPVTPRVTRLQPNEELEGFEVQDASNTSAITDVVEGPEDPEDPDKHYQVTFQPGDYSGISGIDVPDWVNVTVLPGAEFDDGAFTGALGNVVDLNRLADGALDLENLTLEGKLRVKNDDPLTGDVSVFDKDLNVGRDLTVDRDALVDGGASVGSTSTSPAEGEVIARDFTETSSRDRKTEISDMSATLRKVMELEPKRFRWKDTGEESLGLVAEDVADVFPELVSRDKDGEPEGVKYSKLSAVLVQAVKDLAYER